MSREMPSACLHVRSLRPHQLTPTRLALALTLSRYYAISKADLKVVADARVISQLSAQASMSAHAAIIASASAATPVTCTQPLTHV